MYTVTSFCLRYVTSAYSADVLQSPRCIQSLRFAYDTLPVPTVLTCFSRRVLYSHFVLLTLRYQCHQCRSVFFLFSCLFTLLVLLCLFHSTNAFGPPYWLTDCSTHIFLLAWVPSDRPHVMSQPRLRSPSHIAPHQLPSSTVLHHRIILLHRPAPPFHRQRLVLI